VLAKIGWWKWPRGVVGGVANAFAQRCASISSSMSNHKNDNAAVAVAASAGVKDKGVGKGQGRGRGDVTRQRKALNFGLFANTHRKTTFVHQSLHLLY